MISGDSQASMNGLASFHPAVGNWFASQFDAPTAVQSESWPLIADDRHVLITAPTGSGKTLTAFLWSLNRFATGEWQPGRTRVLYISPLKALNNDIRRNLHEPLAALTASGSFPAVTAQTRSGDTSQTDRQRMLRRPPEILITTPESLFLLLTNRKGREALSHVETVILDEIHSIVDNRRGAQLMTSLERLVDLAGEFQRVALSATIRPLETVAAYVGGFDASGAPRPVEIVDAGQQKTIEFRVRFPEEARQAAENGQPIWDPLADAFRRHISANHSTLFFTNSRRLAEKITLKINQDHVGPLAYAHHGSLAREIRTTVESRLKTGELQAIVATNSLEMGIDIGHLDEVVMVQSPGSVSSALQRIGRAGHRVGETSVGTLYPTHPQDFLEAAALAGAVAERDIEPLKVMRNALDVLAQVIVSCCAQEAWHVDHLYDLVRRSAPYRQLSRENFDLLVEMLAGRYAGSRVRELKARVSFDRIEQTVKAQKSALFALYNSGGTIPDRGYYKLRHVDSGALIGELDEEFVWEAKVGQTFSFGTQNWQVQRITHNDVLARPATPGSQAPPFWRSESVNRSFHYSERITRYLQAADELIERKDSEQLISNLVTRDGFEPFAAEELADYLARQRDATGTALPHRQHLLLELVRTGPGGYRGPDDISQLVIHTFWGGQLNRPWALALESALRDLFTVEPEIHADNNAIAIQLHEPLDPGRVLGLVTTQNLPGLLRQSLEHSGFFGARFRECAGRALLLTRQRFNERLPLWMSRLQAKKLMTAVMSFTDFPVLLESWRTCLEDEFDLPALNRMLGEIQDGSIRWTFVTSSSPSPFASNLTFDAVSRYMYADDTPDRSPASSLSDELIRNALGNESLRPKITPATVMAFVEKRQRTLAGYEPQSPESWEDWLKDRVLIPAEELDAGLELDFRHGWISRGERRWLVHPELLHGLKASGFVDGCTLPEVIPRVDDARSATQFALEMLTYYGPSTAVQINRLLPTTPGGLLEETCLVSGHLVEGSSEVQFCDAENFEALMRLQRALARPEVVAKPAAELPGYLSRWQGFGRPLTDDSMADACLCLRGYRAPARVWLNELMASRFSEFADHHLDQAITSHELSWYGSGRELVTFGYPEDAELVIEASTDAAARSLFADPHARYPFLQLADQQPEPLEEFNEQFWQAVWRGEIVCDSLTALRQGLTSNYTLLQKPQRARAARSARRGAGRVGRGWAGNWSLRDGRSESADPLSELEDNKERARLLLDRYGFVCRELANREGGNMRWAAVCKALFSMELSGEIVAGYFFEALSGPQFMTPGGLQTFMHAAPADTFWINALDPASPCGLGLADERLPVRRPQNYLSYLDGALALVAENNGQRLRFFVPPDHDHIEVACAPLLHMARTQRRITVDTINAEPTSASAYLPVLSRLLIPTRDHKQTSFEPR